MSPRTMPKQLVRESPVEESAHLDFRTLRFSDAMEKGVPVVRVTLLNLFVLDIPRAELERIGSLTVRENTLEFASTSHDPAARKFNFLLTKYLPTLRNRLSGNPGVYIHRHSGIPLIGNLAFGIVDKGTTLLELKPLTSCNANCVFCSVDEGPSTKKILDYVVEKDYLVEEFRKLMAIKDKPITVYLNPQGDPTLYADLVELVRDIAATPMVKDIVLITNGVLLHSAMVDELKKAGLTSVHLSLSAIDPETAKKVMGTNGYDVERVKKNAQYIAKRMELLLTPVYVPGMNDAELPKLIAFAKSLGCTKIGIQNFMNNPRGRNPVKPMPMDEFLAEMKQLEEEHGIQLLDDTPLGQTKELKRPFKRGDVVRARIVCPGRYPGEKVAASQGRCILVPQCSKEGEIMVRIRKSNHNIFVGERIG